MHAGEVTGESAQPWKLSRGLSKGSGGLARDLGLGGLGEGSGSLANREELGGSEASARAREPSRGAGNLVETRTRSWRRRQEVL